MASDIRPSEARRSCAYYSTSAGPCPMTREEHNVIMWHYGYPAHSYIRVSGSRGPDNLHTALNAHVCCIHDPKVRCCDNHPGSDAVSELAALIRSTCFDEWADERRLFTTRRRDALLGWNAACGSNAYDWRRTNESLSNAQCEASELRDAASALLRKMTEIEQSGAWQGLWALFGARGGKWPEGLDWAKEREALREVLDGK